MENYVRASLETHLFFGRIMKEHSLFLQAGFPAGETGYRSKASWYRDEFEKVLQIVHGQLSVADRAYHPGGGIISEDDCFPGGWNLQIGGTDG